MADDIRDRFPSQAPLDERLEAREFGLVQRLVMVHVKMNSIGPEGMSQQDFGGGTRAFDPTILEIGASPLQDLQNRPFRVSAERRVRHFEAIAPGSRQSAVRSTHGCRPA